MGQRPLRIANSCYHVGHELFARCAEEQGFFVDEGLESCEIVGGGLIPGPFEGRGLSLAMWEHSVDVATSVRVGSVLEQARCNEDIVAVAAWRVNPYFRAYGRPAIRSVADLKGRRIGVRELGSLEHAFLSQMLRGAGLDPQQDVVWVADFKFAYRTQPEHVQALLAGEVDCTTSTPPLSDRLEEAGCNELCDPLAMYPGGRPEMAVVVRRGMLESRANEVSAFLRAMLRTFWFVRCGRHLSYLRALERRLRRACSNEHERRLTMITSEERLRFWNCPISGRFVPASLERAAEELVPGHDLPLAALFPSTPVAAAFADLKARPELAADLGDAEAVAAAYGF